MTEENPWAEIIGPCYTTASFARALGWTEPEVAEAATSLRVLELVTSDGKVLYPAFQVWEERPVQGLGAVLQALSAGSKSQWTWAQWLNARVDDESGEEAPSAIEQLRSGQVHEVLRDATHTARSWTS